MVDATPFSEDSLAQLKIRNSHIKKAYDWFLNFIGLQSWESRRKPIIQYLRQIDKHLIDANIKNEITPIAIYSDWFGWYLYLIETELYRPLSGDPSQLSRIAPTFETIGKNIDAISTIPGIENIMVKLFSNQNQPDSTLFEILVANCYRRNGWQVEFLPENRGKAKTADLLVRKDSKELFVECKRLAKATEYSEVERQSWGRKWRIASQIIESSGYSIHINVIFTAELMSIPDDAVGKALIQYLKSELLNSGTELNKFGFRISANEIDVEAVNFELSESPTKPNSPTMIRLLSGEYEWWCGYTNGFLPLGLVEIGDNELYALNINVSKIRQAVSSKWRCLAKASIDKKAKDVARRAGEAACQIPDGKTGVVHIAYEAIEGDEVEFRRGEKIQKSLSSIDCKGKDVSAFVCHAITNYADINSINCYEELYPYMKNGQPQIRISDLLPDPLIFA